MKYCKHCKRLSLQRNYCIRCGTELTAFSTRFKLIAGGGTLCAVLLVLITCNYIVPEFYKIKPGVYEVGVDIPAGEYVAAADAPGMLGRVSGGVYTNERLAAYVTEFEFSDNSNVIFTVEEGQFVELEYGYMYQSSKPSLLKPFSNCGVFLVGRDLLPGIYVVKSTSDSYIGAYNIYTDISDDGELLGWRQGDWMSAGESTVVTLKRGDYFETNTFCRLSLRPVMLWELWQEKDAAKPLQAAEPTEEITEPEQDIPEGCYGNGTYEVGADIPAGEYVIAAETIDSDEETPRGYLAIYGDAALSEEKKLCRNWVEDNTIMQLENGQFVVLRHAYLYESSGESRLSPFKNSGFFHTGRDIEPGTYLIVCNQSAECGEYKIFTSLTQNEESLKLDGTVESGSPVKITLEEGDYLLMRSCNLENEFDFWPFD